MKKQQDIDDGAPYNDDDVMVMISHGPDAYSLL